MSNITKKIVAFATTLACGVMLVPGLAQGATVDELQAQINALLAQLSALQSQLSQVQTGQTTSVTACQGITFTRTLVLGSTGSDVKCLQALLNTDAATKVAASGAGSPGAETTYFGNLTKAAVIKFQEKYAPEVLTPLGLTAGTGTVGPKSRAKLNSMLGAGGTLPPSGAGQNKVSLATDNPASVSIAKGAMNAIFVKYSFCAASEANTISKIILTRGGLAADADVSYIKLYDGTKQLGSTQALNTVTHKATFSSINWTIPANSCKTLTVKATVATGATTGDSPAFGIAAASDITSTIALDGTFPMNGNQMTLSGITVGGVDADAQTSPSGSVVAGGIDQAVAGFKFTATSTEGVKIHSIKLTEVGSSVDADVSNIKLFYGSTQIGSTMAALTNGSVTFDLSAAPLELTASQAKTITVYITVGTQTSIANRTISFEITQETDVVAYGTNSNGQVTIWGAAGTTWPQTASSITITLGGLTIAQDLSESPSATTYVKGTSANKMVAFKFTSGAYEGTRITQLKLAATGTGMGADTNVSNVTLYDTTGNILKDTAGVEIPPASMISGYVTFGSYTTGLDAVGLFDVAKSTSKTIVVKADIPTGATAGQTIGFALTDPRSYVKADGLDSQNDLATSDINGNSGSNIPSTPLVHTINATGTLTVQLSPTSPAAATYPTGVTNYTLAKFDLVSVGEDVIVSQFDVTIASGTTNAAVTDVNNIRLYDGTTLLATDANISSGKAEFGPNLTVPKNTTKTLSVVVDILTGSTAATLRASIAAASDLTLTGKDSGTTIGAAGSFAVYANTMTLGTPTLTVKQATTPVATTYIKAGTDAHFSTFYLVASNAEDIKVTSFKIAFDASDTNATGSLAQTDPLAVSSYISNAKLYDGSTQVGTTIPTLTHDTNYDYASFTGLSLNIPKGTSKAIDVKASILDATDTVYFFADVAASTHVTASGQSSGQSATISMEGGGIAGQQMTLGSSGYLTVALDANTPISALVLDSTTADFGKWKFSTLYENILISKLIFDVTHSSAATGTSVAYQALSTSSPDVLATSSSAFLYSLNDGATQTCSFATTTGHWGIAGYIATEIQTDCPDLKVTNSSGIFTIYASSTNSAAAGRSIEISDYPSTASNAADNLMIGLAYAGTESIGAYAGSNNSVAKVTLTDGTNSYDAFIGDVTAGKVTYNFASGSEIEVSKTASKVLTLKSVMSDYTAVTEGSTLKFTLGAAGTDFVTNYVIAAGKSSGTTLTTGYILTGTATSGTLSANTMYLYATKPVVSLNSASPSGSQSPGSSKEVFRFDVQNPGAFDLYINAIRFSISTNATGTIFQNNFNLDQSTDLTTSLGLGTSVPVAGKQASSTATTAYVAPLLYEGSNSYLTIGAGSTITYVLKGDTSSMNKNATANDTLTISIEDKDFFWDDYGFTVNANMKVPNLPVTGGTLIY